MFYSPQDLAIKYNLSYYTIRKWCKAGMIKHITLNRTIRIDEKDWEEFLNKK
jgi:predicted site-specific integrase-resolvase